MASSIFDSRNGKKRDQTLAVDLGGRTTKAVRVQRRGQGYVLGGYALLDAPICEKTVSADMLVEHLKAVTQALTASPKYVTMTVGVHDAVVRHTEMPRMPIDDLRQALKLNSKTYLQQDLPGHVFDCHLSLPGQSPQTAEKPKELTGLPKQRVLVAGARKQMIDDYVVGAKGAGLIVECVVPGLITPVNVFEKMMPDVFANEAVALVDLGFKNTTICIIQQGELILSRVVGIGGTG